MFWRKKAQGEPMIEYENDSLREAFRFTPGNTELLEITFMGKKIPVKDISAGGISFINNKEFTVGDTDMVTIRLKDTEAGFDHALTPAVEIVEIDSQNICHCRFQGLDHEEAEIVHRYILLRQKRLIRKQKKQ